MRHVPGSWPLVFSIPFLPISLLSIGSCIAVDLMQVLVHPLPESASTAIGQQEWHEPNLEQLRIQMRTSIAQCAVSQLPPPIKHHHSNWSSRHPYHHQILLPPVTFEGGSSLPAYHGDIPSTTPHDLDANHGSRSRPATIARRTSHIAALVYPSNFMLQNSFIRATDYAMPAHARQNPFEVWVECQCCVMI
jgi:hypothetical protein